MLLDTLTIWNLDMKLSTFDDVLFFSWAKLVSGRTSKKEVLTAVKRAIMKPLYYSIPNGFSFIINPYKFGSKVKAMDYYYDYLELAALRNYFDIAYLKDPTLARVYAPHYYSEGRLKSNPLLTVTDTQIIFKLE